MHVYVRKRIGFAPVMLTLTCYCGLRPTLTLWPISHAAQDDVAGGKRLHVALKYAMSTVGAIGVV